MRIWLPILLIAIVGGQELSAQNALQGPLEQVYHQWRNAMVTKNLNGWREVTSRYRQVNVRNQLFSERRPLRSMFALPAAPPDLKGLVLAQLNVKGPTAKAVYFGTVDFGVGGRPTENLLVLSYLQDGGWKYDGAEFITLTALPDVRKALSVGDYSELKKKEFLPTGTLPSFPPVQLTGPVKYVAKAYCFCPNREVTMQVNRRSRHTFANVKEAQVIIGGIQDGENLVEFKVKDLPGGNGKEPLAIRVYVLSERPGVRVPALYAYDVQEGGALKKSGQGSFQLTLDVARQLGR